MTLDRGWPIRLCLALFASAVSSSGGWAQSSPRYDGVNGCSVAIVETDEGRIYRHTINLRVPEEGYCRVYIGEDKDRKSWKYCWLKRASDNPVSGTCDDPVDDKDFDVWKAKAVCGKFNSTAYCHRDKPLKPSPR